MIPTPEQAWELLCEYNEAMLLIEKYAKLLIKRRTKRG